MTTYQEILKELNNKIYKPIYFLFGEESYFIDKITDYIADNVLNDAEKAFNQTILYGKDSKIEDIINNAKRFPMMANYQVLIVKEAQNLRGIEKLAYYVEQPLKSTILVINYKYKKLDKRTKLYKILNKNAVLFESKKLYENQIPAWINTYLKEKKYSATPISTQLLTDFLGNNLSKITNELDKLMISLPEKTIINPEHIEKNIGISKDFNDFELQNAVLNRNILKANRIIQHFGRNTKDNPIIRTINTLASFFIKILTYHFTNDKSKNNIASVLKINPYFVKDYVKAAQTFNIKKVVSVISLLREYDMKAKGYNNATTSNEDLLKELIFKIMH
ncbi:MAG: DNA polymerase III subunit delta [Bacteroidales bacterium]|nr:DNA polymerase III subunit delta [Bacteroidales bacterium]